MAGRHLLQARRLASLMLSDEVPSALRPCRAQVVPHSDDDRVVEFEGPADVELVRSRGSIQAPEYIDGEAPTGYDGWRGMAVGEADGPWTGEGWPSEKLSTRKIVRYHSHAAPGPRHLPSAYSQKGFTLTLELFLIAHEL